MRLARAGLSLEVNLTPRFATDQRHRICDAAGLCCDMVVTRQYESSLVSPQRCIAAYRLFYLNTADEPGEIVVPIPALTANGYLPVGAHDCTLDDIEANFTGNPHRAQLLNDLRRFLHWLSTEHGLDLPYYVDGSYTTGKAHPSDIDFIIDISDATPVQIGMAMNLYAYQREQIKADFRIDFLPYHPGAGNDLRQFFQYVRTEELNQRKLPSETRKGILRILP